MFAQLKGPPQIAQLEAFTNQMDQLVKEFINRADVIAQLNQCIVTIISSEVPDSGTYFIKISDTYRKLENLYRHVANSINRAIEDFKDINARYVVGKRLEKRRQMIKQTLEDASKKGINFAKADKLIDVLKDKDTDPEFQRKLNITKDLYETDCELIEFQKKFSLFKMRRVKSGWMMLTQTFSNFTAMECSFYNELAFLYRKALGFLPIEPEPVVEEPIELPPTISPEMLSLQRPAASEIPETDEPPEMINTNANVNFVY